MTSSSAPRALYLAGQWVTTEATWPVTNPATAERVATVCVADRSHVKQAFEAAQQSFAPWRDTCARERGQALMRLADALERESEPLAKVITLENGKSLAQSRGEVAMSVDHLRWFAEEGKRAYGRVIPPQVAGKRHFTLKAPIGPVGVIGPWNFPLVLLVRKAAPAWAAGCPVVMKPAPQTPLSALELARLAHEAQLPAGLLSVLLGPAEDVGAEMLQNSYCRKISFTGSTAVGRHLIAGAAEGIKPLSLELGGHAAAVVFDDASLKQAVASLIMAKFRNTGQSCIAANRIYVQRPIMQEFVAAFVEAVRALKVGGGLEPGVEVGPLIDERALQKAEAHIADAVARGAHVVLGGRRLQRPGHFLEPTVLVNVAANALCMNEETFAPVAPICVFDTEAEVIERANASNFGLAAYAFTQNLSRALRVAEALEAGTVTINDGVPTTTQAPFGGMKHSGWGRELGTEGLDAFLETKHVCVAVEG